jgi:3'-phosphoadenosine 5'-phosphosulfate sulfotransferase
MLTIQHKALTVLESNSITIAMVLKQTNDYEEVYSSPTHFERIVY